MSSGGFEPPALLKLCVNACLGSERASSLHEDLSTYLRASVNVKAPGVARKTILTQNKKHPQKPMSPGGSEPPTLPKIDVSLEIGWE
jgi:hypothetical protein